MAVVQFSGTKERREEKWDRLVKCLGKREQRGESREIHCPYLFSHVSLLLASQDIGGKEKFSGKTKMYYENCTAAIVVVDATQRKSLKVVFIPPSMPRLMLTIQHLSLMLQGL